MSNGSVTDETILAGFKSLHEAMAEGFDRLDRKIEYEIRTLRGEMNERFAAVDRRFAEFEARMMRRFDERDVRLDDHERRIVALEAPGRAQPA
jgi:BMFP domain-containing protein YqiC